MHQISMLGDQQHSDSAHYLRPDRVYRTSVLAPMTGFRPGQAVQATAQSFTQGPYRGMSLSGFGQKPSIADRVKAWWRGLMTPPSAPPMVPVPGPAAASQVQVHSPGASMPPTAQGYERGYSLAPAYQSANFLAPHFRHIPEKLVSRAYGQSTALPPFAEEAATKTAMMMWRGLRWPWH